MGGTWSRNKGLAFERWVANQFKAEGIFPDAKRHLENQAQEAKGYDLDNTGIYRIQCKRYKKYAPLTAIEEVQLQAEGEVQVLVTKPDNKEAMACLPFTEFLRLLKIAKEQGFFHVPD